MADWSLVNICGLSFSLPYLAEYSAPRSVSYLWRKNQSSPKAKMRCSENKNAQHVGPGEIEGTTGVAQIPGPPFDVDRMQVISGRVVLLCIVASNLSAICHEVCMQGAHPQKTWFWPYNLDQRICGYVVLFWEGQPGHV